MSLAEGWGAAHMLDLLAELLGLLAEETPVREETQLEDHGQASRMSTVLLGCRGVALPHGNV